ncbi:MAG: SCO family protein [Nitrospirota bacterium]|nr:SCO family protein [Nitrospirota bacterium]
MIKVLSLLALALSLVGQAGTANAKSPLDDKTQAQKILKATNDTIGRKVDNYTFVDQDGSEFTLKDLRGKPLIVSFIYTSCPAICPTITGSLSSIIEQAGPDWGKKFSILTVGIDIANDTPDSMKEHAERFISDFSNWKFASMKDQASLDKFLKEFGFYYSKLGEGNFDHINMISLLDGRGVIYQHLYGITYKPEDVMAALNDMSVGKKPSAAYSGLVGGLKLFCSVYDPVTKSYTISFAIILNYFIQACILFGALYWTWSKNIRSHFSKKKKKQVIPYTPV